MKHTDLYDEYKKLDAIEREELIAAINAHGGEYIFIHRDNEDGYDFKDLPYAPIVAASTCYMSAYEDFYISRVIVEEGKHLAIYGFLNDGYLDNEEEIESVALGHLSCITDMIKETETVKDVSIDAHKHKIYAAFGTDLVEAVAKQKPSTIDAEIAYSKSFRVREFNTQAEADAYVQGLDDACGWMENYVLNPKNQFESKIIDKQTIICLTGVLHTMLLKDPKINFRS